MEIIEVFAIGLIGIITGISSVLFAIYYIQRIGLFETIIQNFIMELAHNEDLQRSLYETGGIIGSGVKTGMGIAAPTRKAGKLNLQDLIIGLGSQWLEKQIPGGFSGLLSTSSPETPSPPSSVTMQSNKKW